MKYLQLFETKFKAFFGQKLSPREYYEGSVSTALGLSYEALKLNDPVAAGLLSFCGCLDNSDISWELFHAALRSDKPSFRSVKFDWIANLSPEWFVTVKSDQDQYDKAITSLVAFSFVRRNMEADSISIHPVVHQWTLSLYESQKRDLFLEMVADMVVCDFIDEDPVVGEMFIRIKDHALLNRFRPHAERCVSLVSTDLHQSQWDISTLVFLGAYFTDQKDFRRAQPLLQAGRYRLDKQQYQETEAHALKDIKLRLVLSQRYLDFVDACHSLEPAENALSNLLSARNTLRNLAPPRNEQWLFYDVYAISALIQIYSQENKADEIPKVLEEASEEHKKAGLGLGASLRVEYLKAMFFWFADDEKRALEIGQRIICEVEKLLHNTSTTDMLFQSETALNNLRAHARLLVGQAHNVLGNQDEGVMYISRALIALETIDSHDSDLLDCAYVFYETKRSLESHRWNTILQSPNILRPSTLQKMNFVRASKITDSPIDQWSHALNATRTVVRYRPGTLRFNRLVAEQKSLSDKKIDLKDSEE